MSEDILTILNMRIIMVRCLILEKSYTEIFTLISFVTQETPYNFDIPVVTISISVRSELSLFPRVSII